MGFMRPSPGPTPRHPTRKHWIGIVVGVVVVLALATATIGWRWAWLGIGALGILSALARFYLLPGHR